MNFVAIDFETANPNADSACAIGLVKVENFQVVEQVEYLIRPPSKWFEFTYIHDIDWSMVADKPTFGELHPQIDRFLAGADFLAAHNASFDRKVLAACRETYQLEPKQDPIAFSVPSNSRVNSGKLDRRSYLMSVVNWTSSSSTIMRCPMLMPVPKLLLRLELKQILRCVN
jgi:DNA polymerase III epsilon subunit-like protein